MFTAIMLQRYNIFFDIPAKEGIYFMKEYPENAENAASVVFSICSKSIADFSVCSKRPIYAYECGVLAPLAPHLSTR